MKYLFYIIIGLGAVVVLYFIYTNREQPSITNLQQNDSQASKQTAPLNTVRVNWETKIDDQPPVAITVTPVELGKDADDWKFQIVFDTHSGSLDDDLLAVASLVDDAGNVYRPIAWDGLGPGGHHREGVLIFEAINPVPTDVELQINNIGGIPVRSFKWSIL